MNFRKTQTYRILVALAVILLVFVVVLSFKESSNEKKFDSFNKTVYTYSKELDKLAFGEYEEKYSKILDEVKEINRTDNLDEISKVENKLKGLLEEVKNVVQAEINNQYNTLLVINIDKLDDENKLEVEKIRGQISELIDKGYYRVAYNEINILTNKINTSLDEISKKEEEDKKKQEEEERKKVEEKKNNIEDNQENIASNNEENEVGNNVENNMIEDNIN